MYVKPSILRFMSVLIVASFALIACQPQSSPTPAPQASPVAPQPTATAAGPTMTTLQGVLTDPALATNDDSKKVNAYLFEGLVTVKDGQPAPALATSWTISEDQLDYVFQLRTGVQFSDGTPFNADAVVANFNRWFDPQDAAHGSGTYDAWLAAFKGFKGEKNSDGTSKSTFDGIEKVDDFSVIVHLNTPSGDVLTTLSQPAFAIVSPASLATVGFGTSSAPGIGTGPYKIGSWTDQQLQLVPNSSYWGTAPTDNMTFAVK